MSKLILGDCLEELRKLPHNSVDLIVTDPPFFLPATHYQSRIKHKTHYADLSPLRIFWDNINTECVKVLKKTGHMFVFCNGQSYPAFYEPMYNSFDKIKNLVWDKTRVGLGRIFRHQHELIIWGRWEEHKIRLDGKLHSDVLKHPPTLSKMRLHPVEKPVNLLKELINPTTDIGDVVLDPFMGGGSTIIAAKELKRDYIGIELSEHYYNIVKSKLSSLV